MKFNKILIISLISIILLSLFVVPASAEEIDYNTVIGIKDGDTTSFYSLEGMRNATWKAYIGYYNYKYENSPFKIVGSLVLYENNVLIHKSTGVVSSSDITTVAAGVVYTLHPLADIYSVSDNTLTFNVSSTGSIKWKDLIDAIRMVNYSSLLGYGEMSNNICYNKCPLSFTNSFALPDDNIHFGSTYTLRSAICNEESPCSFEASLLQDGTCQEPEIIQFICSYCGLATFSTIGTPNHHKFIYTTTKESTCSEFGTQTVTCEYCSYYSSQVIPKSNHDFTITVLSESTCYKKGLKKYECNVCGYSYEEDISELEHDLNYKGKCQRSGCDYSVVEEIGTNIKNTGNDFWNWLTGKYEDGKNWLGEQTAGLGEVGESVQEGFRVILIVTGIVAGLTLLSVLLNLFDKISKPIKNLFERFKRKNKRR